MTALLGEVSGKRVLDAGCAAGWYAMWLADRGATVTALDVSPKMVEKTRARVGGKAVVLVADLRQPLDVLDDGSQDIVLSSLVLHYIKDWNKVLREFHRKLAAQGRLVFSVHHPFMDYTQYKQKNYFTTTLLHDEWNAGGKMVKVDFYRRPMQQIINPLARSGFIIEEMVEPQPTEEFRRLNPEWYAKLMTEPWFLCLRARKA
ncbi:MAG: class I SAM-dependent methyltransferase [bacterium]|jgi:SAM-dependent methyltransferase